MPTILSHPAVPLAIGLGLGAARVPPRLVLAGVLASILPDADVLAFKLGIAYEHAAGHRGVTHSLAFAALLGLLAAAGAPALRAARWPAFLFVTLSAASHGLLDMLTNGGLGVALFWPLSASRWFFPWQVIEVSPIGISRFLSERGLTVLLSEGRWIWLPAMGLVMLLALGRLRGRRWFV